MAVITILLLAGVGFAIQQSLNRPSSGQNFGNSQPSIGGNVDFARAGDGGDSSAQSLPACGAGTAMLDHLPISDLGTIEALGHMYAEHILPNQADHIYLYPTATLTGPSVYVYAPGNVTLLQVAAQTHTGGADVGLGTDYTLFFSPCKSVMFGYIHVKTISSQIQNAMAAVKPDCNDSGALASNCIYADLSLKLSSGEVVGTGIGPGYGVDFGAADVRTPTLAFINKTEVTGMLGDSYTHAVCPLDYFTSGIKAQLYAKLTTKNVGANGIPACGLVMQDLLGTAQGNWYRPGTSSNQGLDLKAVLALAHDNIDPTQAVVSAGSDLLPSTDFGAQIFYQPKASGYINRDPGLIKPDGHVYCFEGLVTVTNVNGHVDLSLTSPTDLKADYGSGACAASPALSANALSYSR